MRKQLNTHNFFLMMTVFAVGLCLCGSVLTAKAKDQVVAPRPLVVLKQAVIEGQVFVIADKGETDFPASDLKIEVAVKGKRSPILTTTTDKQGAYTLKDLDVGLYDLTVGLLVMELKIEDLVGADRSKRSIPKKILVFIPEAMRN